MGSSAEVTLVPLHEVEFRDAVFERVELDWSTGQTRVFLSLPSAGGGVTPRILTAKKTTLLRCTREHRWTESARVYELRHRGAKSGHRLEIEIQSGDVLELEAETVGFEP